MARLGAAAEQEMPTGLLRMEAEGRPKRDCFVYVPKAHDKAKRYPLVVVLHPAGVKGANFVRTWGDTADRTGAFIVAGPECKDAQKRAWTLADEKDLIDTIKKVANTFNVDSTRILLTGFSQGGVYTYTFGLRNPAVFRAIAPLSGALVAGPTPETQAILEKARGMAAYIVHGAADTTIPVQRARVSRDILEKAGLAVTYREVAEVGHLPPVGELDRIWAWFAALTTEAKEPKGEVKKN